MRQVTEAEAGNIFDACEAITDAIDDLARELRDSKHPLEVGEVLSALFTVMIASAQASPNFDPDTFVAAFTANLQHLSEIPRPFDA